MHTNNRASDFWFHHPLAFVSRWAFYGALLGLVVAFLISVVYAVLLFLVSKIEPANAALLISTPVTLSYLLGYVPFGLLLGSIFGAVAAFVEKPWWDGCDDCEVVTDEEIEALANEGVVVEESAS